MWLAILTGIIAIVAVGAWSSQVPYKPVVSNRSYDELLTAAGALDEQGIPYRLEGQTLEVPASMLGRAKSAISTINVLPGLADVGELKLGLTPQAQEWAFLRAREGDIARMVNGIDGVAASRVNIVPKKEALFFDDAKQGATASVFVRLTPGARLNSGQVSAIVNLVANAVDGLEADAITVVDDAGNLLAEGAPHQATDHGDPRTLFEYRTRMEHRYETAVSQALLPMLGYDNAFTVTASVDLDLTSSETVTKKLDIKQQALVSEQLEETIQEKADPNGVPGVDANVPERAGQASSITMKSDRSATTANYTYPTVDEISRKPAGGIIRVSIAVQVNSARITTLAETGSITEEELKKEINNTIQAAVGYSKDRNDQLNVNFLPFTTKTWVDTEPVPTISQMEVYAPFALAALALMLTFWFIVRPLVANATDIRIPKPELLGSEGSGPRRRGSEPLDLDSDLADRLRSLVDNYEKVDASDLNRLVQRESVAAAQVLRQWNRT
jgi:flagellar M-ring protein FliF